MLLPPSVDFDALLWYTRTVAAAPHRQQVRLAPTARTSTWTAFAPRWRSSPDILFTLPYQSIRVIYGTLKDMHRFNDNSLVS